MHRMSVVAERARGEVLMRREKGWIASGRIVECLRERLRRGRRSWDVAEARIDRHRGSRDRARNRRAWSALEEQQGPWVVGALRRLLARWYWAGLGREQAHRQRGQCWRMEEALGGGLDVRAGRGFRF